MDEYGPTEEEILEYLNQKDIDRLKKAIKDCKRRNHNGDT